MIKIYCSFELIQRIEPHKISKRYTENQIINIKPDKYLTNNAKQLGDYKNDYIVQSGWEYLNIYIKKDNDRYYFYKNIKISSRIYTLFNFESFNLFIGYDYFSNFIYIYSSITLELITIIKDIKGKGTNLNPFGKINNNILIFLGLHKIYLYNIKKLKLIQEIKFNEKILGKNVILSEKNTLLISLFDINNQEYKIKEYQYYPEEKKLKEKNEINSINSYSNFIKDKNFFLSKNKGKRYLIILNGDNIITLLK